MTNLKDPKKKSRRSQQKYPGLNKSLTTRIRSEFWDFDYIDKLSEQDKEFLNKFIEEELNSSFKNDGSDFNKTKAERKKIFDRNNAANRCLYSNLKNKSNKKLLNLNNSFIDIEEERSRQVNPKYVENAYVDFLEAKEIENMLKEYNNAMLLFNETSE